MNSISLGIMSAMNAAGMTAAYGNENQGVFGVDFSEILKQTAFGSGAQVVTGEKNTDDVSQTQDFGWRLSSELTEEEMSAAIDSFFENYLKLGGSKTNDIFGMKMIVTTAEDDNKTYEAFCALFQKKAQESGVKELMALNPYVMVLECKAVSYDENGNVLIAEPVYRDEDGNIIEEEEEEAKEINLIDDYMKALKEHYDKRSEKKDKSTESMNVIAMAFIAAFDPERLETPDSETLPDSAIEDIERVSSSFANGIPEEEKDENRVTVPAPKEDDFYFKLVNSKGLGSESISPVMTTGFSSAMLKINDASSQIDTIASNAEKFTVVEAAEVKPEAEAEAIPKAKSEAKASEKSVPDNAPAEAVNSFNIFNSSEITIPEKTDKLNDFYTGSVERQITEQITAKIFEVSEKDGVSEMTIVLKPENLGEIAVKLTSEKGVVSILLSAQNEAVANTVNERISSLTEGLANKNIEIKDINVISSAEAGSQMGLDFTNQGFNRRQEQQTSETDAISRKGYLRSGIEGIEAEVSDRITDIHENIMNMEAKLWARA